MGNYIDQSDLEDRFGEDEIVRVSDRDRDGNEDVDLVADAISDAESEVDSYLGTRYRVPVQDPPRVLVHRTCDIAHYLMLSRWSSATEQDQKRYDDAIEWLERVAAGQASLGTAQEVDESDAAGGVRAESKDRFFGRDKRL